MSEFNDEQGLMIEKIDVDKIRNRIVSMFSGEFVWNNDASSISGPPVFKHVLSGQWFRYAPGGQFLMGLSEKEEIVARAIFDPIPANISEMRPVHLVRVPPFLMAERPLLTREISGEVSSYPDSVAYVPYEDALAYCKKFGMTLSNEAQWEYACRAGSDALFTWGDYLPDDEELAAWLTFDFGAGYGKANAFGLYGLFVGEWCSDFFKETYDSSMELKMETGARVVRGGGAYFWPWQDQEWVWCMSAMRAPSTDLPEGKCGFRLVRNIPEKYE
jgi:formylglycine-generating enzyme